MEDAAGAAVSDTNNIVRRSGRFYDLVPLKKKAPRDLSKLLRPKVSAKVFYRATDDEKAEFNAMCRAHGLKPGTFNRNVIEKVMADYRRFGPQSLAKYLPQARPARGSRP